MKKLALVTALAAVAATTAHADVTVYGKAAVGLDYTKVDTNPSEDSFDLSSNASRIGFKGSEELNPNLEAFYQAEAEVALDTGDTGDKNYFKARNTFVGLKHITLGSILVGFKDTLIKEAQGKVDLFNDLNGGDLDMKKTLSGEERAKNTVEYALPTAELPVELKLSASLDNTEEEAEEHDDNAYFASLGYDFQGLGLTVAYGQDAQIKTAATGDKGAADIVRVVGTYDLMGVQLGALYQNVTSDDIANFDDENSFLVSASFKATSDLSLGAQFQQSTTSYTNGAADTDIDQYGVIATYKVAKPLKMHGYLVNRNVDDGTDDFDTMVVGTAMEYKF